MYLNNLFKVHLFISLYSVYSVSMYLTKVSQYVYYSFKISLIIYYFVIVTLLLFYFCYYCFVLLHAFFRKGNCVKITQDKQMTKLHTQNEVCNTITGC